MTQSIYQDIHTFFYVRDTTKALYYQEMLDRIIFLLRICKYSRDDYEMDNGNKFRTSL